jgi:uncharacterized membrane-anchored protein YjiN (DUF445 family)
MKRRATGLLVVMGGVFVAITRVGHGRGWWGYAQAGVEASLVGGLADWFAVTALFRHPAGVPIPHTAIIQERKDDFGKTLGDFIQENFLTSDVISERVRNARISARLAEWLIADDNADIVSRYGADLIAGLTEVVRDEDVHRVIGEAVAAGIDNIPLAPIGARAIRLMTEGGRHQELLDAVLRSLETTLDQHRDELRERFGRESPWWLPGAVEDRIFDRLLDGAHELLHEVNNDPDHEFRKQFDAWVAGLADRLEHSPELAARSEEVKRDLLNHPELRAWLTGLWADLKGQVRAQAADGESQLRRRLAELVVQGAKALQDDPAMAAKVDQLAEAAVRYIAEHFHGEIAGLVSGTIARWDAAETSAKLELLLGPDLQFIRINGTVVGGLAGLAIHAIAVALA